VNSEGREAHSPVSVIASVPTTKARRKELRMLGAYTFWDAMWTMIVFFAWIMFITWVIMLMIDNFRRKDHSGWSKALWALFIIFLPIIGAFSYTIARPATADYGYEPGYGYAPAPSAPSSTAAELARLNELRTEGAISDAEFEDLKARTIAAS
jgi:phospholipase D-like protein